MDCAINETCYGNNVVDGLNAIEKRYLKEKMGLIGKLGRNDTTRIGMLPSASE